MVFLSIKTLMSLFKPFLFSTVTFIISFSLVGEIGLEPTQIALSVPKTDASTNSAIRPQNKTLYILLIEFVQ